MLWSIDCFFFLLDPVWVLVFSGFVDLNKFSNVRVNASNRTGYLPVLEFSEH